MGKERNEEQEFLENIERFLNGEEVTPVEDSSEDVRSTMEFAKKLTELHAEPSPEFRESLKSKLLRKLTEQEMAARERVGAGWFGGLLGRLVPQSPVWRTAAATVAIVVVAAGVMWQTGLFSMTSAPGEAEEVLGENDRGLEEMEASDTQKDFWSQNGIAATGEEEEETLDIPPSGDGEFYVTVEITSCDEVVATVEPCTAQYGTEITLVLTFVNNSDETVTINPVQPAIVVKDFDEELVYTLSSADGPGELLPSESFQMPYAWEQQNSIGVQVPAGKYQFDVSYAFTMCGEDCGEITLPLIEVVIEEPE